MKKLLEVYAADHDIQNIPDPYACADYIVAYMSTQWVMSNLMAQACREDRNGELNLRQQVSSIGNKFLNAVEVSAQEAVYLLLQLPVTRSSRSVVFTNTSPAAERTFILKSKATLQNMHPDDTDIEAGNIMKRSVHSTTKLVPCRLCVKVTHNIPIKSQ